MALKNIARRPVRSLLTVLGVAIGMTAVVGLLGLSGGVRRALQEQFERLGHDLVLILPVGTAGFSQPQHIEINWEMIRSLPGVAQAGGLLRQTLPVVSDDKQGFPVVLGLSAGTLASAEKFFSRFELAEGRLPAEGDEVLLSRGAAQQFEVSLGETIRVREHKFRISGILEPLGDPRTEGAIFMPLASMWELIGQRDVVSLAWVKAEAGYDVDGLAEVLEAELRPRGSFQIQTSRRLNEIVQTIIGVLRASLGAIAGVALLVGAIGLMNTMYMAVLERTREIGIFMSLGAQRGQIFTLFFLEAGLLGLVGGVFGVILGTGLALSLALLIAKWVNAPAFSPMISASLVGLSLLFSTGLGIFAGLLPARRAAMLQPVTALRYE